jgi:hypothetical protein
MANKLQVPSLLTVGLYTVRRKCSLSNAFDSYNDLLVFGVLGPELNHL